MQATLTLNNICKQDTEFVKQPSVDLDGARVGVQPNPVLSQLLQCYGLGLEVLQSSAPSYLKSELLHVTDS